MRAVFADTLYWVSLTNKLDALHEQAVNLILALGSPKVVTTELVMVEYLNFFAEWGEHFRRKAIGNVRIAFRSPRIKIVPHTHENFLAGMSLCEARMVKGYSLTDCVSMQAMREEGLTDVLTNDRHFEQEGFQVLFRAS
jgi:predicted nucleic acid-binding protein